MEARVIFPAFCHRKASEYHWYLADIIPFHQKISEPGFRTKAALRSIVELSNAASANACDQMVRNVRIGTGCALALDYGIRKFWTSWFEGIAMASTQAAESFAPSRKSAFLVTGRSSDEQVVSVRFDNRTLSERALKEIRG